MFRRSGYPVVHGKLVGGSEIVPAKSASRERFEPRLKKSGSGYQMARRQRYFPQKITKQPRRVYEKNRPMVRGGCGGHSECDVVAGSEECGYGKGGCRSRATMAQGAADQQRGTD